MYSYIKAYEMILTPWDKTQSFFTAKRTILNYANGTKLIKNIWKLTISKEKRIGQENGILIFNNILVVVRLFQLWALRNDILQLL